MPIILVGKRRIRQLYQQKPAAETEAAGLYQQPLLRPYDFAFRKEIYGIICNLNI